MEGNRTLERVSLGYATAAIFLQALLIAGCDRAPEAPTPINQAVAAKADAAPAPQGEERLVLAFGDSLYAGYGLERGQSLPDLLQERLRAQGINARVVNSGVSGDTTAAGRRRLTFALDNLPHKPDLVVLGLGGNDALRQIAPEETRANLEAMLEELRRREVDVLLTGMVAPPNLGPDYAAGFNPIWPELARAYDAMLYPFILDGVITEPGLMQSDRVHPTAEGVERMADRIAPLVAEELRRQDS